MKSNPVGWFEIPVTDMDRAKAFYEKAFEMQIKVVDLGGTLMGWFPNVDDVIGATGSLIKQESYIPSHEGTLVYFSSADVQIELNRIETAGGKILQGKTQISPEHGYMAVFEDTEGNRVALHSRQ
ncbi:MAG: VOC family protein [Bacteroidetes bacterium]|nr:VOC family protein [Bacteroidota bacterium]